jgi:hypothetical protein
MYVHKDGQWHLAWSPGNNTTVFNTPGVHVYTVPPGVYNLLGSYQTPTGITTGTILNVQPGQFIGINIGNYGTTSSVTVDATTYILPAYDTPVLQFSGRVDASLVVEFSVVTPDGKPYRGGIGGTVTSVSTTNAGTGYPDLALDPVQTVALTGQGTGLTVSWAGGTGGVPGSVLIFDGGIGYNDGDTVKVLAGNQDAVLTVQSVGSFGVGVSNGTHQTAAGALGLEYQILNQTAHGDLASTVSLTPVQTNTFINPDNSRLVYAQWSGRDNNYNISSLIAKGNQYVAQFSQNDSYADEGSYNFLINLQQILSIGFTPIGPSLGQQEIIKIIPEVLPRGKVGSYYYAQVFAQGTSLGPYTWSIVSGSAPSGLTGDPVHGLLFGTPSTAGTSSFTVKVVDTILGGSATKTYSITILPSISTLTISPSTIPAATVGAVYNQQLTPVGGTAPYVWGINAGSLPDFITLNANTGLLNGVPQSYTQGSTYTFNVVLTDVNGYNTATTYTLNVGQPALSFGSLAAFSVSTNTNQSHSISITGNAGPFTAISALWQSGPPSWNGTFVSSSDLNAGTFTISGIPSDSTNYSFILTATDATGLTGSVSYTLVVN